MKIQGPFVNIYAASAVAGRKVEINNLWTSKDGKGIDLNGSCWRKGKRGILTGTGDDDRGGKKSLLLGARITGDILR